jgi:hypothetical protein
MRVFRGRFHNVVDLVKRLMYEAHNTRQGSVALVWSAET